MSYRRLSREASRPPRVMMARPLHEPGWVAAERQRQFTPRRLIGPAVLVLIGGVAIAGILALGAGKPQQMSAQASPTPEASAVAQQPSPSPSRSASPRPSLSSGSSGVGTPRATPSPTAQPSRPRATPRPSPTPPPAGWAPQSAAAFDQERGEVIDIDFPFKPGVRYHYRDNWWDVRPGSPEEYNHARSRRGEVVRAHDGVDIYASRGSAVVAPFAGVVIDPAERWLPWHRERYGGTVVIISSEPQSEGYAALMTHLDATFVEPGTLVRRGEVVGLAGNTGNAEESRVHLHFELRAPFDLAWLELGGERPVDAFNPYPSLVAADPRRD